MLNQIKTLLVVIGFFISLSLYGSRESPWGTEAFFPDKISSPDSAHLWRQYYADQLDSMNVGGLTWNRGFVLGPGPVRSGEDYFSWDCDSMVIYMQERGLNTCRLNGPPEWDPWSHWPRCLSDTIQWIVFWDSLVNRYDGKIDGAIDMPGLMKPIKHWNIANDGGGHPPPGQVWEGSLPYFRMYNRISHRAIHDADPEAKVVTLSCNSGQTYWVDESDTHDFGSVDAFWDSILGWGYDESGAYFRGLDYIDIIGVGYYTDANTPPPGTDTLKLEELKNILVSDGAGDKPVWITELGLGYTGYESDSISEEEQAHRFMHFSQWLVKHRDCVDKVFFFSFLDHRNQPYCTARGCWGMLYGDRSHKPAYDSLQKFIFFTSEKNDPTGYNNQRKLIVDGNWNLHFVTHAYGDIRYVTSAYGVTWKGHMIIGEGKYPAIAVDGAGRVHVCWVADDGLHYRMKTVVGWEDDFPLYTPSPLIYMAPPSIDVSAGKVHIALQFSTEAVSPCLRIRLWD